MGFQRNVTGTYYKVEVSFKKKKKKNEKVFKEWHWVLPQVLDCPVSPLEFGIRSLQPSFKLCVFLYKTFNV